MAIETDVDRRAENICGYIEGNLWMLEDTGEKDGEYSKVFQSYENAGCDKIYQ